MAEAIFINPSLIYTSLIKDEADPVNYLDFFL
jgi:hypothetical protein